MTDVDDMLGDLDESINTLDESIASNEQQLKNVSSPAEIDAKASTGLNFESDYLTKMLEHVQSLPEKDRMKFLANLSKMKKRLPESNFTNTSNESKESVKSRLRAKIQEAKMTRTRKSNLKYQYEKSIKPDNKTIGSLVEVPPLTESIKSDETYSVDNADSADIADIADITKDMNTINMTDTIDTSTTMKKSQHNKKKHNGKH